MMNDNRREFTPSQSSTKKTREQLVQENSTDPLTGIGNRLYWEESLLELSQIDGPVVIFIIDVNDFKKTNDDHGHIVGDNMLRIVARLLDKSVRPNDILARIGGDEFGIALPIPKTDPDKQAVIPNIIIDRINQKVNNFNKGSPVAIKLSIGYEISPSFPHNITDITNSADQKMYLHKADQKKIELIDGAGI